MATKPPEPFKFEISLSVLNHLGRNLYRNFLTVLGEAISNAWDADAKNIYIYIDRANGNFAVVDDGHGMTQSDFQGKFLKIGYSKRQEFGAKSVGERPFIGAKGIGKLALLSCADRVMIASRVKGGNFVGGLIDNTDLGEAIKSDKSANEYELETLDAKKLDQLGVSPGHGTVIFFEKTKEDIRNRIEYIRKMVALNFRFSLLDEGFTIHIGEFGEDLSKRPIKLEDLDDLLGKTQFAWNINEFADPLLDRLTKLRADIVPISSGMNVSGFVGSVEKPRFLKVFGTDDRAQIDLFVNGRLREKDILKHFPTTKYIDSYLYGQVHFDELESSDVDRFTSSREGVVESDALYQNFLKEFKENILDKIVDDWDRLRLEIGEEGDDENKRKSPKQRKAAALYSEAAKEYSDVATGNVDDQVKKWLEELRPEGQFNIPAYLDCFLAENLLRKQIVFAKMDYSEEGDEVEKLRKKEKASKAKASISIEIREESDDLSYLDMRQLARVVDGPMDQPGKKSHLSVDANVYKPLRDAMAHTSLLTNPAKTRLTATFDNIQGRVRDILSGKQPAGGKVNTPKSGAKAAKKKAAKKTTPKKP